MLPNVISILIGTLAVFVDPMQSVGRDGSTPSLSTGSTALGQARRSVLFAKDACSRIRRGGYRSGFKSPEEHVSEMIRQLIGRLDWESLSREARPMGRYPLLEELDDLRSCLEPDEIDHADWANIWKGCRKLIDGMDEKAPLAPWEIWFGLYEIDHRLHVLGEPVDSEEAEGSLEQVDECLELFSNLSRTMNTIEAHSQRATSPKSEPSFEDLKDEARDRANELLSRPWLLAGLGDANVDRHVRYELGTLTRHADDGGLGAVVKALSVAARNVKKKESALFSIKRIYDRIQIVASQQARAEKLNIEIEFKTGNRLNIDFVDGYEFDNSCREWENSLLDVDQKAWNLVALDLDSRQEIELPELSELGLESYWVVPGYTYIARLRLEDTSDEDTGSISVVLGDFESLVESERVEIPRRLLPNHIVARPRFDKDRWILIRCEPMSYSELMAVFDDPSRRGLETRTKELLELLASRIGKTKAAIESRRDWNACLKTIRGRGDDDVRLSSEEARIAVEIWQEGLFPKTDEWTPDWNDLFTHLELRHLTSEEIIFVGKNLELDGPSGSRWYIHDRRVMVAKEHRIP